MNNLLLLGAGSGSREVALLVSRINAAAATWTLLGYVDDDPDLVGTRVDGLPVFAADHDHGTAALHVASGLQDPATRERMLTAFERRGATLATLIAPDVILPPDFHAEPGCVVMPGVIVSFDVQLGRGTLVMWGVALGHHLRVGAHTTILTRALIAGGCRIGARATIGAGAIVNVKTTIGDDALVGVGTTVLDNYPSGKRAIAVPRIVNLP